MRSGAQILQRAADRGYPVQIAAPEPRHSPGRPGSTPPRIVWVRTPYGWKPA